MRFFFPILFMAASIGCITSCNSKKQTGTPATANNSFTGDSLSSGNLKNDNQEKVKMTDTTLVSVKQFFEKELAAWAQSFKGFHIDSFRMIHRRDFENIDYKEEGGNLNKFYELYKPSLSFSPDSSYFIDLYSAGVMLEKRGKKIVASADVDQAITLCNLKTKEWKRIAFFGPSGGIEEAVWTSPSSFILAGSMRNDNNEQEPFVLAGDVNSKSFRSFEAKILRPETSKYEASGLKKLKIDEWE